MTVGLDARFRTWERKVSAVNIASLCPVLVDLVLSGLGGVPLKLSFFGPAAGIIRSKIKMQISDSEPSIGRTITIFRD
jgi:hypothetical protein